jgi:hypothetical protein
MPTMSRTVVTLTANQAAGTDPVLAANTNRTSLVAGNPTATEGVIDIANPGAGEGMPFPAGGIVAFGGHGIQGGPACPTNAIYVDGFAAADVLTFWES